MLVDTLFEELKKIVLSIEVKYRYLGEKKDTADSRYNADRYISAMEEADSFYSYPTFDVDAIVNSGLTLDPKQAAEYATKPTSIPESWRPKILEAQRRLIVDGYVEMNDYFRRINGLPETGDTSVYLDVDFYSQHSIDFKPLHEFNNIEILLAESQGIISEIKQYYPNLKYLDYLGTNRIPPYKARKAANFQVLRVDYMGDGDLLDTYLTVYEQCREYAMRILYVNEFSTNDNYYDRFMGLMIAVMAVQRTIVSIYQGVIRRDFFDVHMIQALFESYGVPFIESLPMDYQRLLAKNLDKLLHFKSTDKVIYDIAEILGFNNARIFKYLLVKDHQFDDEGKPIFEFTEDEDGNKIPKYDTMYDVYFQTMELGEDNEEFALADKSKRVAYNEVVADDVFWWDEDEDLLNRLYETEFNHIETKYLHMNIMVKITEMIFEVVTVFRLLQDKRKQTQNIEITLPRILSTRRINLFTYTMFMCAAVAKRNNLRGEIITSPSKTLYLMGFDFGNDLARIKQSLEENSQYVDKDTIAQYIRNMEIFTPTDVNRIFNNIRSLWEFLSTRLKYAKTIEEYRAYERIYRALIVTQDMEDIFKKSNGEIAETYLDMLEDLDPYLASIIKTASQEDLFSYLNHGIDAIEYIIKDTKYLYSITDTSQVMVEALRKLILFFKSYTVDLKEFNVIYVLDHPYLHAIKIISQIRSINAEISINDTYLKDMMMEFTHVAKRLSKDDLVYLEHEISTIESSMFIKTALTIITRKVIESEISISDSFDMIDDIHNEKVIYDQTKMILNHALDNIQTILQTGIQLIEREDLTLDVSFDVSERYNLIDHLLAESNASVKDNIRYTMSIEEMDTLLMNALKILSTHKEHIESIIDTNMVQYLYDIASINTSFNVETILINNETLDDLSSHIKLTSTLIDNERLNIDSDISISSQGSLIDIVSTTTTMSTEDSVGMNESIIDMRSNITPKGHIMFNEVCGVSIDVNTAMRINTVNTIDQVLSRMNNSDVIGMREQISIIRD